MRKAIGLMIWWGLGYKAKYLDDLDRRIDLCRDLIDAGISRIEIIESNASLQANPPVKKKPRSRVRRGKK